VSPKSPINWILALSSTSYQRIRTLPIAWGIVPNAPDIAMAFEIALRRVILEVIVVFLIRGNTQDAIAF
jgi:hypothetical protein